MMYRNLTHTTSMLLTVLVALILTGCGGGGDSASGDTQTTNNSVPTSLAASSANQSSELSSSLAISSAASIAPPLPSKPIASTASSAAESSAAASYIRASRSSSSSIDDDLSFDDEIIIPEDPTDPLDHPPTQPADARVLSTSATGITISWNASSDDKGVVSYEIRRNGIYIASNSTQNLSYNDSNLAPNTAYTYTVRAVDTIGHRSAFSNPLLAKTRTASNTSSSSITSSTTPSSISSKSNSSSLSSLSASSKSNTSSLSSLIASSRSSSSTNSKSSSSSLSSQNASSQSSAHNGFLVEWPIPTRRENGDYLELHEIGGYELRHKLPGDDNYTSITISSAAVTSYILDNSAIARDSIEVAAFDVDGRYSRFINLLPK